MSHSIGDGDFFACSTSLEIFFDFFPQAKSSTRRKRPFMPKEEEEDASRGYTGGLYPHILENYPAWITI